MLGRRFYCVELWVGHQANEKHHCRDVPVLDARHEPLHVAHVPLGDNPLGTQAEQALQPQLLCGICDAANNH